MSPDPKKASPKKTVPQRSSAAKKTGTPAKVVKKAVPAKPTPPKKEAPVKKEKKQGSGLFSSVFGIFKKKTHKEEPIKETIDNTKNINEEPQNETPADITTSDAIAETTTAIEQEMMEENIVEENIAEKEEETPVQEEEAVEEPTPLEPQIIASKAPVPEIQFPEEPEEEKIIEKEEPVKEDDSYKTHSYSSPVKEEPTVETEMETVNPTHTYNYSEQTETPENNNYQQPFMNTTNNENPKEEKKKKRGVLLPFLIISLVANVILGWLLMQENEKVKTVVVLKEKLVVQKDSVVADLEKLKVEFSTLETKDTALQKELEEKRTEIEKMIVQAKKHQNDAYTISKLRKETETLRKIMKHFVVEIDSLNTLNQTIIAQKNQVTKDLNSQINKTNELEKDKDALQKTVSKGSVLKAMVPKAMGIKIKGGTKEVDVNKASRVEKIKVSFTLSDNPIAKKGTKTIYIHIMGPNGKEVTVSESEQNSVQYDGTRGFYAEKKDIEYDNAELPVDVLCGSPTPFVPGKYLIDVICEGTIIGQTDVILK